MVGVDDSPPSLPTPDLGGEHLVVRYVEWFTVGGRGGEEPGTIGEALHLSRPVRGVKSVGVRRRVNLLYVSKRRT